MAFSGNYEYSSLIQASPSFFFLNKLKVCGNPALSKSVGAIFPTVFAHLVSLCHSLVILTILQTFFCYYICYSDL